MIFAVVVVSLVVIPAGDLLLSLLLFVLAVVCSCCCLFLLLFALAVVCSCCCLLLLLFVLAVVCSCCCLLLLLFALAVVCSCRHPERSEVPRYRRPHPCRPHLSTRTPSPATLLLPQPTPRKKSPQCISDAPIIRMIQQREDAGDPLLRKRISSRGNARQHDERRVPCPN
jgi:hypothetical protein